MALKATIHKAELQLSDIDRGLYADYALTIARHPSETDERMMVRLLAYALQVPADDQHGPLELAKDLWEAEEPALWQKDYTGEVRHWIEVGQPDERQLLRLVSRVEKVTVYSFLSSTPVWWKGLEGRLARAARNLRIWQIPAEQSQGLATLAQRTMRLQVTVQDGAIWVSDGETSREITPVLLFGPART